MKNPLVKLTQATVSFIVAIAVVLLLLTSGVSAQTDTCANQGVFGGPTGTQGGNGVELFCDIPPADTYSFQGGVTTTCKGCVAGGLTPYPHSAGWEHGGTATCTQFDRDMVIEFSQPVADVEISLTGARRITSNMGHEIRVEPILIGGNPLGAVMAFLPGPGITQITISDPVDYQTGPAGGWRTTVHIAHFRLESDYYQCNCNRPTFARPNEHSVSSPDWSGNGVKDWRMDVEISDDDGLVLKNVRLENRYMAEKISVPYYLLDTASTTLPLRGELTPAGTEFFMRSRLVNYQTWDDTEKFVVEAIYVVDQLDTGPSSCLQIIQHYEFYKAGVGCEPSETLPCARWKPFVSYRYIGPPNDFQSVNVVQRYHFMNNGFGPNSVGVFRDCDRLIPCLINGGYVFREKLNPLGTEWESNIIRQGKDGNKWDNFHQTYKLDIHEPAEFPNLLSPGCPECVHFHWRWGAINGPNFGDGKPLIKPGSNQDVDIAVSRARATEEEEDPQDYLDLVRQAESIRTMFGYSGHSFQGGEDVVFWYSSTGYQTQDKFFPIPGGFYNPSFQGISAPIDEAPTGPSGASTQNGKRGPSPLDIVQDHPETVVFGDLYEDGPTTYTLFDSAASGSIPNKYEVYGSNVYDIATEATVSGPHVVTFIVPSVTDQTLFNRLRILHKEPDSFDRSAPIYVDRTILSPDTPAPDFTNKKISARTDGLGTFFLATLVEPPPDNGVADLSVTVTDAPDAATAGGTLTYTVTVTNNGPQTATHVMLNDMLAPEANFISATPSQGTCSESEGRVLCFLNSLAIGQNAVVTINVRPVDGSTPFPPEGKTISNLAAVKAVTEEDSNLLNNTSLQATFVLPDPNLTPSITIDSPVTDTTFVGPVNINLSATATDDGSITNVDFYQNDTLIGAATTTGNNQYTLQWTNVTFGNHTVVAVATDNLGKIASSEPVVINVNGTAAVSIVSPANWSVFALPAAFTINATATVPGGTINKVDFYSDGDLLGTGTLTSPGNYAFSVSGLSSGEHRLRAVATDNSGIATTSSPVPVVVNSPPAVSIINPVNGTVLTTSPVNMTITANANDWEGVVRKVDFYANGALIGTKSLAGVNQFPFTWSNVAAGTYAITAVATDNYDATKTSAPVTIRVNALPTISITSPSNGSQFAPPANITLTANASDDGSIAQVVFFANGANIGSGTPLGGNQYSLTWSNVQYGSYAITAVATDNDGVIKSTAGPTVAVTSPVLFVAGSTTLNSSDAAVKARLEALNHTVIVKDGASATTADATGKALVVISSTVTPTSVGTKFRTVTVPVITWESGLFNNMGMTGSTNKDFGTKTGQTQVSITNPGHPLAAGFPSTVTVVTSSTTLNWGKPNANAALVATVVGDTAKTVIFGYETGTAMPGLTAPARRVGLFLHDTTAATLNSDGTALLDGAIQWARGGGSSGIGGSLSGNLAGSPVGSVNLTTGSLDWAHWGRNGPTAFDHRSGITQRISNVTKIGSGGLSWFTDCPTTFSWTNGTPIVSATNTPTGINTNGSVGDGFEITLPADMNLRILKLYVGVWYTQGKLEATLSDGSAPAFIDTSLNNNAGSSFGLYTINFKAASTGQSLKIRFTILTQHFAPNGNVAWEAARLQ